MGTVVGTLIESVIDMVDIISFGNEVGIFFETILGILS